MMSATSSAKAGSRVWGSASKPVGASGSLADAPLRSEKPREGKQARAPDSRDLSPLICERVRGIEHWIRADNSLRCLGEVDARGAEYGPRARTRTEPYVRARQEDRNLQR